MGLQRPPTAAAGPAARLRRDPPVGPAFGPRKSPLGLRSHSGRLGQPGPCSALSAPLQDVVAIAAHRKSRGAKHAAFVPCLGSGRKKKSNVPNRLPRRLITRGKLPNLDLRMTWLIVESDVRAARGQHSAVFGQGDRHDGRLESFEMIQELSRTCVPYIKLSAYVTGYQKISS